MTLSFVRWVDRISGSINIKRGWKDYQGVIHNNYHGGKVETDHHVILLIPEDMAKHFSVPNFTAIIPGTLREVLDNDIASREKISLNGLGIIKGKYVGLSMMLKTGLEVAQDYTVFNYGLPSPHK